MSILLGFVGDFDEVAVAEPEIVGPGPLMVPDGLDVHAEFADLFGFRVRALDVEVREIGGGTENVADGLSLERDGEKGV